MTAELALDRIVRALGANGSTTRTRGPGQVSAQCPVPAHNDGDPSLSLTQIQGSVLMHCFGGCATTDVLASIGLTQADLYDERRERYRYDDGRSVHRSYNGGQKAFAQYGIKGKATPTLYRLSKVVQAVAEGRKVALVEGEKDVHALESLGVVATTAPQGASNFHLVDVSPLKGADVVAVVDRDVAGDKWAEKVRSKLHGVARSVAYYMAKAGKDAADHVAAGYVLADLLTYEPVETAEISAVSEPDKEEDYWTKRVATGGNFVLDAPERTPAVWGEGNTVAWAEGESLMICGPAGVGKTTLTVQLVAARMGIGDGRVLGMPVWPGRRKVLYLAMDRPPQIARAMARLFTRDDREALDDKLIVWKGPPPFDLAKRPETLVRMCELADADTVIVDSLKDGVSKLSGDEEGNLYNKARQKALIEGIEVIEQHHQRKAGGENKKPSKLEDVYGSVWLGAGAGSVFVLWGEAGDPVVELIHIKQPMEPVGPLMVMHDHKAGRSSIHHQTDLLTMTRYQGAVGLNPKLAAGSMFSTDKPTPAQVEKARRKLKCLVESGHLIERPGHGQNPASYFLAERGAA